MRAGAMACLAIWAACGSNNPGDADASAVDARLTDAPGGDAAGNPDAASGPVTVRVLDDTGAAIAGVAVIFHAADGTVIAETVTDGAGEASHDNPPAGAMASILPPASSTPHRHVQTIVGIEAGDVIQVGAPAAPEDPTLDVRVDYPGAFSGADQYLSDLGCTAFGVVDPDLITTRSVGASCLGSDDDYDVMAVARQGTVPLAFSTVRDVAQSSSGPTDLVLPAWVPAETRELGFANLTAEVNDTDIDLRPVLDGLTRWPALGTGDLYTVPDPALVDGWLVLAAARAFAGTDARTWARRQVLPAGLASPHALDFADFGPRFDTLDLDVADPLRPAVTWTSSASTATYSAVVLVATWTDLATAPDSTHRWTVVRAPGSESAAFPVLPDSAASFRPSATADYQVLQVFAFWFAQHADYGAFRNDQPFALGIPFIARRPEEARMLLYQKSASN